MLERLRSRLPTQYRRVAYVTLGALTLIVLTGAAVRLTGSGLGCPDWPRCYGTPLPPLSTHALIEFGNRALSGLVGVITVVAAVLAFTRRPFRRDLAVLAVLMPLGVVAQAVLGGFTVREHLAPGFVMAHFSLSMIILIAAVALAWRARFEPGARPRATDRVVGLVGARARPARRADDLRRNRRHRRRGPTPAALPASGSTVCTFKGADTLTWVVHQHATIAARVRRGRDRGVAAAPPARRARGRARAADRARRPASPPRAWSAASSTSSSCRRTWSGCT